MAESQTAACDLPATHRWTVSGRSAVSHGPSCVPLLSLLCVTDTQAWRHKAPHHLQLSLIVWSYGKRRKSKRRSCRRAAVKTGRGRMIFEYKRYRGRRIRGPNGNVSFMWRLRAGHLYLGPHVSVISFSFTGKDLGIETPVLVDMKSKTKSHTFCTAAIILNTSQVFCQQL